MKINIAHFGSTDWFNYKADIIYGLYHAIRKANSDVTISHNSFSSNRLNLIIGADWLSGLSLEKIKKITNSFDYCIYEVEYFDGLTINNRKDFNTNHYLEILNHSKMVITPYLNQYNLYNNLINVCPTFYSKWAYFDEVKDINIVRNFNFERDAIFFGLIKGAREKKAKILESKIKFKSIGPKIPHTMRSYYLSSSKYGLLISAGENEKFINPFRLGVMLGNDIPVFADITNDEDNYRSYAHSLDFSVNSSLFHENNKIISWKDAGNLTDSITPILSNY